MTTPNETTPLTGTTAKLLHDWPDGATYVFNRDQLRTVIDAAKLEAREEALAAPAGADLRAARKRIEALPVGWTRPEDQHGPKQYPWLYRDAVLAALAASEAQEKP